MGGCAFEGSLSTLLAIEDAAHLVHGTMSCLDNNWEHAEAMREEAGTARYGFSTGLSRLDLIEGGEAKLRSAIDYIAERFKPPVIFVYDTCATVLAMEDLDTACRQAAERWGIPVVPIHSAGNMGSRNMGNRLAGEALFHQVIGKSDLNAPLRAGSFHVNLIGNNLGEAEGKAIEDLLSKIGVRVLASFGRDSRFANIQNAHQAKVNMVLCNRSMITLARRMKESYGIPYFEGSFYGSREIRFSLRQIAFHFQNRELDLRIARFIRKKERALLKDLVDLVKKLKGKRVLLYTEGIESWAFISALQELGLRLIAIGTNGSNQEDLSRIRERAGTDTHLIPDGDDSAIVKAFRVRKADLMIVSGSHTYLPIKEKLPFLEINTEKRAAYTGYEGVHKLGQDVLSQLEHPIWEMLKWKAPWDGEPDDKE